VTTRTNRRAEVEAWRDLSAAIALAASYTTAAERGARDGVPEWSAGELLNAAHVMRSGAKSAAKLAGILTGKVRP
jgi:hypothetical protein